uniref:Integrin beta n=1 Tax=Gadus morhua TaxID=8049 RepID=A0A8C5AHB6_GADMO
IITFFRHNFTNWLSVWERCDTPETLLEKGCLQERLEFHVSHAEVLVDGPLGRRSGPSTNSTQVSPQRMALKLRPGIPMTFQVRVQQTEDYPVDIYYLMDLSASMTDDLEMIKDLGSTLTREMSNLTSKFSLGFGSFVEKPVLPFIKITEEELANPCRSVEVVCQPTFGYKHVLSLTTDTSMFNQIISKQHISANIDVPEGGFDAIMQAAVCGDKIGWRNDSMRLLVFASDADSHFGMDSKLAGIVIPNDGQCHLDENNDYSMSAILEYPTLGQLIDKLVENNILLIFAVTENQKHNYENYANLIPGATVGVLASDSRNILELIITAYKDLRSEIELEVLGDTEELQMAFTSICPDGSIYPGLKRCSSIKAGDTVVFNVSVELTSCLPAPGRFLLRPVGYQDGLVVDLSSLCSCHCPPAGPLLNTTSGQGSPECGVCVCQPGFVGSQCECSEEEEAVAGGNGAGCRATQDGGAESCSGQGECFCGRCVCHASSFGRVYGRFCECDDYSCGRFRGELCGGHGQCDCGQCVCDSGWLGEYCNCSSSTEACVSQDGTSCSGRGHCDCGQCVCSVPGASGKLCEKCPTCGDTCTSARACVECHLQTKDSLDMCVQRCTVPKISINTSTGERLPGIPSDKPTAFSQYKTEQKRAWLNRSAPSPDCPEPPNVIMIILGVSLSVLLVGLVLLVAWRLLVSVHDRKEVARFEAERSNAKWQSGTNPLFRSSTSTFKNVTYKNTGRDKSITLGR